MPLAETLQNAASALATYPTAPYHEHQVRTEVTRQLGKLPHVQLRTDRYGNVIAHYRHRPKAGPGLALVAHLDHPGFVIFDRTERRQRCAEFLGGVARDYFKNQRVLFYADDHAEPLGSARIERIDWDDGAKKVFFDAPFPSQAAFGMWDLPAFRFRQDKFISRACDDLAGAATIVALIAELSRREARAEVWGLFTRAEEVGFQGALCSLKSGIVPASAPILSLETSNARGFAKVGAGPILRVGDRTSIFTPSVTQWLQRSLEKLKSERTGFIYQRLLMGGGTCEATIFQQAGHPTGALCLALQNYHNMHANGTIAAEAVSLRDWQGLFDFLLHLAVAAKPYTLSGKPRLNARLRQLQQEGLRKLRVSAGHRSP